MAFTIPSIFTAVDKFSSPVRGMTDTVSAFASKAETSLARADRGFRKLTGGLISETGKQFMSFATTAAVAASVIGGITYSVKSLQDYESAVASFRTIVSDATDTEFAAYREQINKVASDTKKSSIDVAKSFEMIAGLNADFAKTADGLAAVSNASITLAKASGQELGPSAENLVGIMNQFQFSANEADRAINVLAAGQAVGAANIAQTAEAFKNFGSTAKNANLTLEQSVGLIQTLGKFSITGAEAGTKLRGAVSKLQEAGVGYTSGQFNMNDALTEAKMKIDKLSTAKAKDEAISKIFGLENKNAGLILLNNIGLYEEYTRGVTGTTEASKAAAINSNTLAVKIDELKASWVNMLTSSDSATSGLNSAKNVIGFVADNLDTIVSVGSKVLLFFGAWKAALIIGEGLLWGYNIALGVQGALSGVASIAIGQSTVALNAYKVATFIATGAQWLWNAAMGVGIIPLLAIVAGIGLLIAIIYSVVDATKGWGDQWTNIMDYMGAKFEVWKQGLLLGWNLIEHAFVTMVDKLVLTWKWGQNLIGNISDQQYEKDKARIAAEQKMRGDAIIKNTEALTSAMKKADQTDLQWKLGFKTATDVQNEENAANYKPVDANLSRQQNLIKTMETYKESTNTLTINDNTGRGKLEKENDMVPIYMSSTSTFHKQF